MFTYLCIIKHGIFADRDKSDENYNTLDIHKNVKSSNEEELLFSLPSQCFLSLCDRTILTE